MNPTINQQSPFSNIFTWLAWGCIASFVVFQVFYVRSNSYFIDDDYDHFINAATLPLLQVITTPIDIHYAPLHRLFSVLITKIAPLNFDVALAVLLMFHCLAIGLLYRLLQTLSASPVNTLIVLLYSSSPFALDPLMWWSSGIHRFPYIFLSLVSLYTYVLYRKDFRWVHLACCLLAFLLALGFYSKALIIPLYVIGLELCLSPWSDFKSLCKRLIIGSCMLALSASYILWYLRCAPVMHAGPSPSIPVGLEITLSYFKVFTGVLTFHKYESGSLLSAGLVVVLLIAVVMSACKTRRALLIWVVLLSCVGMNFAIIAFSARGQAFGVFISYALRYYFEVMFLVALFMGLLYGTLRSSPACETRTWHWSALAACMLYVTMLAWIGSTYRSEIYARSHLASAQYMNNLLDDMDLLVVEDRPLRVAQTNFPGYVYGDFINALMPIEKVLSIRYPDIIVVPRGQADYEIDPQGNVLRLSHSR